MKHSGKNVLYMLCGFAVAFSPVASAQVCRVTTASLNGAYGYIANQSQLITTTSGSSTDTGTGTTTGITQTTSGSAFSTTGLGQLLGGIAGGSQFNLAGRVVFDGAGNIAAGPSNATGATTIVGTYKINPDCTITVTLRDAFGTNSATMTLVGIVLGGGAEIDLALSGTSTTTTSSGSTTGASGGTSGSTGTTTTPAAQFGSGLAIKLVRILYPYGCSVSNLNGLYGFVLSGSASQTNSITNFGTGTATGTSGTTTSTSGPTGTATGTSGTTTSTSGPFQPFTLIGHLVFDGNGKVIASQQTPTGTLTPGTVQSSLANLQFTGTYTVNPDCSGMLTLNNGSAMSSTNTGTNTGTGSGSGATTGTTGGSTSNTPAGMSFTANFLLTQPVVTLAPGTNLNQYLLAPALDLTVSGPNGTASGYALPE